MSRRHLTSVDTAATEPVHQRDCQEIAAAVVRGDYIWDPGANEFVRRDEATDAEISSATTALAALFHERYGSFT